MKKTIIVSISALLFLGLFLSLSIGYNRMRRNTKDKIMTREKISEYRQKLRTILNNKDDGQRLEELKQLAKKVGSGYVNTKIVCSDTRKVGSGTLTNIRQNPISESELVLNINNALQTETMIDMCNTAAKNFGIAVVAAIAAGLSALAAWAAVGVKIKKEK